MPDLRDLLQAEKQYNGKQGGSENTLIQNPGGYYNEARSTDRGATYCGADTCFLLTENTID